MIHFPYPFALQRDPDPAEPGQPAPCTLASGTVFPDGTVALRWAAPACTTLWPGIEDAVLAHCRDGRTRVVFPDSIGRPSNEPLRQRIHQAIHDTCTLIAGDPPPLAPSTTEAISRAVMAVVQPEIDRLSRHLNQLREAVGG